MEVVTHLSFALDFCVWQEGASKDDIERLPTYKFQRIGDFEKQNGEVQEAFSGTMTECNTDMPTERVLSVEDAVSFVIQLDILFKTLHVGPWNKISALLNHTWKKKGSVILMTCSFLLDFFLI